MILLSQFGILVEMTKDDDQRQKIWLPNLLNFNYILKEIF